MMSLIFFIGIALLFSVGYKDDAITVFLFFTFIADLILLNRYISHRWPKKEELDE